MSPSRRFTLTVLQQRNVPEAIRSLSTMESPDYVDVFTVTSEVTDKTPEQWAREGRVSFATFVRYDRPMAALVWPAVSIIHRRAVPDLLRYAVKRINRSRC